MCIYVCMDHFMMLSDTDENYRSLSVVKKNNLI